MTNILLIAYLFVDLMLGSIYLNSQKSHLWYNMKSKIIIQFMVKQVHHFPEASDFGELLNSAWNWNSRSRLYLLIMSS